MRVRVATTADIQAGTQSTQAIVPEELKADNAWATIELAEGPWAGDEISSTAIRLADYVSFEVFPPFQRFFN